ncbi:MAG: HD domain-containing protein [Candidatus Aenigmatarchaeota archaeon]
MIKLRSEDLYSHSIQVAKIARILCHEVQNKYDDDVYIAALLHDLGKIAVRDSVLLKPGQLTKKEWEQMKMHTVWGYEILRKFDAPMRVANAVLYHHENADGTGYFGLKDSEIPLEAKILRVADVFSAMTSNRVYKAAYPVDYVVSHCAKLFPGINIMNIKDILTEELNIDKKVLLTCK